MSRRLLMTLGLLLALLVPTPLWAAIAYVQSASNSTCSSCTTLVQAYASNVGSADLLVAAIVSNQQVTGITDTQGNVWVQAIELNAGIFNDHLSIWYAQNSIAGATTVTATLAGTATFGQIRIHEYSGVAVSGALDQVGSNTQTDVGTGTDAVTTGQVTTTSNGQLIFGLTGPINNSSTATAGTGFTEREDPTLDGPSEDRIQTTAGPIAATFTVGNANDDMASLVATFHAATAVTSGPVIVQSSPVCQAAQAAAVCTLPSTPTVGNTIVLLIAFADFSQIVHQTCAETKQFSDSQGANLYNLAVETPLSIDQRNSIWWRPLTTQPSGTFFVSVRCPAAGSIDWYAMQVFEVSGLLTSTTVVDTTGWASTGGSVTTLTVQTFQPASLADELVFAVMTAGAPDDTTKTIQSGWTPHGNEDDCNTFLCFSAVSKLATVTGTVAHTWTFTTALPDWGNSNAAIAAFKSTAVQGNTITRTLRWVDNATNETQFRVKKRTDLTFPNWVDVVILPPETQTHSTTITLTETNDCWQVFSERVLAGVGTLSAGSNIYCPTATPPPPPPPPPPTGLLIGGTGTMGDDELL